MELIQSRPHLSRTVLIRILVLTFIAIIIFYWRLDDIKHFYVDDQTTKTGLIVNSTIAILFLTGYIQVILRLLAYCREEATIITFVHNFKANPRAPLNDLPTGSLIAMRFKLIKALFEQHTPIQHGSLASALMATESGKNSLLKYINNILILIGVFGTIISLSIALVGASKLLGEASGMGLIIHGMSTALSTTMTAIVCFIFFSYLYTHVMDVQTNLISTIEQVTTTHLLPRYQVQSDSILFEVSSLIRSLQTLTNEMSDSQHHLINIESKIAAAANHYLNQANHAAKDMAEIKALLREGFRLDKP